MEHSRERDRLTYHRLLRLVDAVTTDRLDMIARMVWRAYGDGVLTDPEAIALGAAIERRRGAPPWRRARADGPEGDAPPARLPFIR